MTRLNVSKARDEFPDVVNRAAYGNERTIVSRRGKDMAAVISIDDLRLLERLAREEMDRLDLEDARAALKEAEEKQKDEEVVDGERLFDHVAGDILRRGRGAEGVVDEDGECQGRCDPEDGGGKRGAVRRVGEAQLAASVEPLGGEEQQKGQVEADPVGDGRGRHKLMLSRIARRKTNTEILAAPE